MDGDSDRTPWGAILVAVGVLVGGIISKVGELITVLYRSRSSAQVALIKAQKRDDAAIARLTKRVEEIEKKLGVTPEKDNA